MIMNNAVLAIDVLCKIASNFLCSGEALFILSLFGVTAFLFCRAHFSR